MVVEVVSSTGGGDPHRRTLGLLKCFRCINAHYYGSRRLALEATVSSRGAPSIGAASKVR